MVIDFKRLCSPSGGRKRQGAVLFCTAVATAGLVMAADKPKLMGAKPLKIAVMARTIASFDKTDSNKRRFGSLVWRGGLELSSSTKHFGGWSGLRVDKKGQGIVAVSDAGTWLRAKLRYDKGRLSGVTGAEMGPLRALNGRPLSRGRDRDAEAISLVSGGLNKGVALIAFEQNDRVGVFPLNNRGVAKPRRYLKLPNAIRKNRRRNGVEALAVLRGGQRKGAVLVFLEGQLSKQKRHRGWLLTGAKAQKIELEDKGGFSITDLASLPDGSVLVL